MVLIKIQLFFLNKCSLKCCKTLRVFQSSEKIESDNFHQFSMEERIFSGPHSIIFADITGFYILIFFLSSGISIGRLSNLPVPILPILFNNFLFFYYIIIFLVLFRS